jgi:hypothetical protein
MNYRSLFNVKTGMWFSPVSAAETTCAQSLRRCHMLDLAK